MSRIDKLTIRGIRGFGPDESDTQRITFTPPLTLILGHNGAGKSTIIECLRMMTTGDMPPGQGQCFVHDPALSGKATTYAKVEIRLTDSKDRSFDISKIFTLTKKDKTFKFSTTDTNILTRQTNENLGSKCLDVNSFMLQSLGVPKAVLQNVIFCHHSESDWPLGEGKALKERFDAIFSATKYVEVLEVLNKEKKEIKTKISTLEALKKPVTEKLANYKNDVQTIAVKKGKLEKRKKELERIREDFETVTAERLEVEKRYHEYANIEQEFRRHAEEYKACKHRLKELKEGVQEVMNRSRESLEDELRNFDAKMAERKEKVESNKIEVKRRKEATEKKRQELQSKEKTLASCESEHRQHEQSIGQLIVNLKSLNKSLDTKAQITEEDYRNRKIENHVAAFDAKLKSMDRELAAKRQDFSKELENLQQEIQRQAEQKASFKTQLESLKAKQDDILLEMAGKQQELKEVASVGSKLEKFDANIEKMEGELEKLKTKTAETNLDDLSKQIEEYASKENQLNGELNNSTRSSAVKNKIKALEEQISKKANSVNNLKVRILRELKQLDVFKMETPQKEWAKHVRSAHSKLDSEIVQTRLSLESKNKEMTKCQTELDMSEKELTKLQRRLKELRTKIDDEVGVESTLEQSLIETEEELNEVRNKDSIFIGTQHVYKKYKNKIDNQKKSNSQQCCPLCDRSMKDKEVKELEKKLEKLMSELPKIRQESEQDVTALSDKLGRLNLLKRDDQERDRLESEQVPSLESSVKKLRSDLQLLKDETADLKKQLETKSEIASTLVGQAGNCDLYDSGVRELDALRSELRKEQNNLEEDCRDVDDVMSDINDVKGKKNRLEQQLKNEQESVQKMNTLQVRLGEVKNERLQLLNKAGAEAQIKQALEKLEKENSRVEKEIPDIQQTLVKASKSLAESENSRTKLSRQQDRQIDEFQTRLSGLRQNREEIGKTLRSLEEYEQSEKEDKMVKAREEVEQFKSAVVSLREEFEKLEEKTHEMELEIRSEDTRRRELSDNIAIIDKSAQLAKMKEVVEKHKKILQQHNDGDDGDIVETLNRVKERHENLKANELTTASDVKNMEKTLIEEEQRVQRVGGTAEKEYKDWLAECLTEKQVSRDLDIGYTALNKAILAFHQEKMTQINRIIADYWVRVYKGSDIDKIQIKFSDDTGASKSTTKRNYQYRVVMIRQGVEQDMRSRCSAGQRVLACLIVRLALAEAFCDGCAMLALDEPTTNLDHENMTSLADILAEIVRSRKAEKNFQMVVITHDEEFIVALSKHLEDIGEVDCYYKVEKNDENLSQIRKRRLDLGGE